MSTGEVGEAVLEDAAAKIFLELVLYKFGQTTGLLGSPTPPDELGLLWGWGAQALWLALLSFMVARVLSSGVRVPVTLAVSPRERAVGHGCGGVHAKRGPEFLSTRRGGVGAG